MMYKASLQTNMANFFLPRYLMNEVEEEKDGYRDDDM